MELGKAKLLRSGLNALYQAIHPMHGIAWTDGKQVALTALHYHNKELKFGESTVIGQFEHVHGLYWSPHHSANTPALLAVQHKKHVSVWQLSHSATEKNKLMVSQTCEVGEPFQLLPQGCVWHPKRDILSVLTKRDASVLYAVRSDNSRVKADIKSSGLIHCACWTKDGNRLVVAISTALHSYIWDNARKTLSACSFCPIFDVGSYICAIEATVDFQIAVATELPLDKICGLNAGITFELPVGTETGSVTSQSTLVLGDEEYSMDLRRKSIDSDKSATIESVASSSSGPVDLMHILANHRRSDPSPLITLRRKDYPSGTGQDSSHLILVTFEGKVTTTRKVSIPGILVPDIIAFDLKAQTVAIASNTCNIVLVYSVTSFCMPNIQQIQLEKSERPKGLTFLTDNLLLILIGKQKFTDPALIPSSNSDRYIIRLMIKELSFEEESSAKSNVPQSLPFSVESSVNLSGKRKYFDNLAAENHVVGRELLIPGSTIIQSSSGRRRMLEELKSPSYEQSSSSSMSDFDERRALADPTIALETLDTEPVNRSVALFGLGTSARFSHRCVSPKAIQETLNSPKNNILASEKGACQISRNLERLCGNFNDLQLRLLEITEFSKNGNKLSVAYPSSQEPPFVHITYQKLYSNGSIIEETKTVLLCDGKIHLSLVQQLFDLPVVEMKYGSSWIVLAADNEGFIPLTFKAKQEIIIREGSDSLEACGSHSFKRKNPSQPSSSVT
ncbi:WD repeat and coiled-coil-containing protein [Anolis carolinensis]|uniref:WD repeat and coiled-coil-containing protein n=1 Tax=Anolis carolinensis TaxID=28377 RepID=R4GD91_ANOCA|nr:PREDICTED: WD repeat and coiled-coil-containing protein C2orf44 homolog [Anolis carolinensis]|eukprot:XP_008115227.1 PREDICTED: WD repeat and coiled-coil-containing protein C2orf44 homolog [Anolis carolinensis]